MSKFLILRFDKKNNSNLINDIHRKIGNIHLIKPVICIDQIKKLSILLLICYSQSKQLYAHDLFF